LRQSFESSGRCAGEQAINLGLIRLKNSFCLMAKKALVIDASRKVLNLRTDCRDDTLRVQHVVGYFFDLFLLFLGVEISPLSRWDECLYDSKLLLVAGKYRLVNRPS
jgi:hypothetical protein